MDNILVYGGDQQTRSTLCCSLNKSDGDKCEFSKEGVKFLGHINDGDSIRADP